MAKINSNYDKLSAGYLFREISRRVKEFKSKNPQADIVRLGVGNTTHELPSIIISAMSSFVDKLGSPKTYTGYEDDDVVYAINGMREAIVEEYKSFGVSLDLNEVFVSDGAKSDLANIQSIFFQDSVVAIQDPTYPAYVDVNVILGRTGSKNEKNQYDGIVYMPCVESNNFFPNLPQTKVDIIYLCSPNNPTGSVATKEQLKRFVDYARKNKSIIIFDAAYSEFISDKSLPKSIYEIEGAKECAIEINSFSKMAGFTGVRLGWTIVPMQCACEGTQAGKINSIWKRRQTTMFNGPSNIAQYGGLVVFSEEGRRACKEIISFYLENARIIKKGLEEKGLVVVSGGVNAPYLWVRTPNGMSSWDFFDKMLSETKVVITPGAGFGPSGEGYFRVSAFGHRENIIKAVESIKKNLRI